MSVTVENLPDAAIAISEAGVHIGPIAHEIPSFVELAVILTGVSLILFVLFVLPLWIFLHYRMKARREAPAMAAPQALLSEPELGQIARIAERMERRLDAMETLMDAEHPGWRR